MPVTLPQWIEGVVFIEEDGAKRILSRPQRPGPRIEGRAGSVATEESPVSGGWQTCCQTLRRFAVLCIDSDLCRLFVGEVLASIQRLQRLQNLSPVLL